MTGVGTWFVAGEEPEAPPAWAKDGAVDFEALRGKVVVLEFWMSWCPGCARTRPVLAKLHEQHPDDLLVLGITATDAKQSAEAARRYVAEHVPFPVALLATGETIARYEVGKIPHAVVVDRAGRVRWRGNPDREAKAFKAAVRAALREPARED
ncbi:MAG: TlpA disulfide reductase family protein [Planctomycetota bacterium]